MDAPVHTSSGVKTSDSTSLNKTLLESPLMGNFFLYDDVTNNMYQESSTIPFIIVHPIQNMSTVRLYHTYLFYKK